MLFVPSPNSALNVVQALCIFVGEWRPQVVPTAIKPVRGRGTGPKAHGNDTVSRIGRENRRFTEPADVVDHEAESATAELAADPLDWLPAQARDLGTSNRVRR